ncbi:hypothetical protein ACP4OV_029135 [Aristida adscensionis]
MVVVMLLALDTGVPNTFASTVSLRGVGGMPWPMPAAILFAKLTLTLVRALVTPMVEVAASSRARQPRARHVHLRGCAAWRWWDALADACGHTLHQAHADLGRSFGDPNGQGGGDRLGADSRCVMPGYHWQAFGSCPLRSSRQQHWGGRPVH